MARTLGTSLTAIRSNAGRPQHRRASLIDEQRFALQANVAVCRCLDERIKVSSVPFSPRADCVRAQALKRSVVRRCVALTIALETGDITRFLRRSLLLARMVISRESNGRQGTGNASVATSTYLGPSSKRHTSAFGMTRR